MAIVDTGSLTEAADAVSLTQSAVSHSLSKLEAELGVTLLERGRQGVIVTRIGEEVLGHARNILGQVEIIQQKTAQERGVAVGKIRFGCARSIAPRLLTGILRDFQTQYPDIEIVFFEGMPEEIIDWLAAGVIDVGTVMIPTAYEHAVPLAHGEMKVVASPQHPLARQTAVSILDFMGEALVGPRSEYKIFAAVLDGLNITLPGLRYEVSDHQTILTMVRENMGISMLPDMLLGSDAQLVALPFDPPIFIHIYLATNSQSPAAHMFMANAHDWAKTHGFLPDEDDQFS